MELLEQLKTDRAAGVRRLVAEYGARLYQMAFRLCGSATDAGAGTGVVLRMRATDDVTKKVEFVFMQTDRRACGTVVPLTRDWREIRLPFDQLRYFSHWGLPPLPKGEKPDARKICWFNFMFGNFLCDGTEDKPHGFEIDSIRVVYGGSSGRIRRIAR